MGSTKVTAVVLLIGGFVVTFISCAVAQLRPATTTDMLWHAGGGFVEFFVGCLTAYIHLPSLAS